MSIAIIEDDANIRNLIKIVLSDLNVPIDEYDNGWKGLDGVTHKKYSLLVLDSMLPVFNGMEICRKINNLIIRCQYLCLLPNQKKMIK